MRGLVLFICLFAAAKAQITGYREVDNFTCANEPPELILRRQIRGTVMSPCYDTPVPYPEEITSGFKVTNITYDDPHVVGYQLTIVDFQLDEEDRLYIGSGLEDHSTVRRAHRNITLTSNTTNSDNLIYLQEVENGPIVRVLNQGDSLFLDAGYKSVFLDFYSIHGSKSGRGYLIQYEADINLCGSTGIAAYCKNGGACSRTGFSAASCSCTSAWTGPTCEIDVDECIIGTDNCHENATCTDTDGSFTCACKIGYTGNGVTCIDINECATDADNDCDATGTCENVDGGYNCNCTAGYENGTGGACSDINECSRMTDNCDDTTAFCTNNVGSFDCTCNNGFSGDGVTCTDIDECASSTDDCDKDNGNCANTVGSFTCTCNAGYTGNGETCSDFDECAAGADTCHDSRATCTNNVGSHTCACNAGYSGNGVTCDDINECTLGTHTCHSSRGTCTNTVGSFTCACQSGYTGDGVTCNDIDECSTGANDCHSNATCTNTVGSWTCACKSGYTGSGTSCTDLNECDTETDNCDDTLATCANTDGSFTCTCRAGYTGSGTDGNCNDINECLVGGHDCDANADCSNTVGSWDCSCKTGFTGTGRAGACTDINECALGTDNCASNATCVNTPGSFSCGCIAGFTGSGTTCSDIDECATDTDNCNTNAACANTVGSFTCTCNVGWNGNGVTCTDINECTTGTNNCDANAGCTNNAGSFTCACNSGWNGNGVTCTDINECFDNTDNCHANAACTNTDGSFSCACRSGYTGDGVTCTDIDECAEGRDNCTSGETTCNNLAGSFECICNRPEYRGVPSNCVYYCNHNTTCRADIDGRFDMPLYWDGINFYSTFDETFWKFLKVGSKGIRFTFIEFNTEIRDDFLSIYPRNEENVDLEIVGLSGPKENLYNEEDPIDGSGYIHRSGSLVTAYYNRTVHTLTLDSSDILVVFTSDRLNASTGFHIGFEYDKEDCPVIDTCKNGGTCNDALFAYQCVGCTGYTGADCDLDINECTTTMPCDANADCNNTVGSFSCACRDNYIGNGFDCKQHIVIDGLVVIKTTTSLTISFSVTPAWDSVEYIESYRINITHSDGRVDSYTLTGKTLTVEGLTAYTAYIVTIEILVTGTSFGDSVVTNNIMSQIIRTAETSAGTPKNPATSNSQLRDRVTLSWSEPDETGFGVVTHYEVCYGVESGSCAIATLRSLTCAQMAECIFIDDQFTTITLLIAPYSYLQLAFVVRAYSSVGPGNWTDPVTEYTGKLCPSWTDFASRTFCPHREGLLLSDGFPRESEDNDNNVIEQYWSHDNTAFNGWRLTNFFFNLVERESTLDWGHGNRDITNHDIEKAEQEGSFTGNIGSGILETRPKNTSNPDENIAWFTWISDRVRKRPGFQVEVQQDGNDCYSTPCLHGGVCSDGVYSYTCDCSSTDYTGDSCEIPHVKPEITCNPGKTSTGITFGVQPQWRTDETLIGGYTLVATDAAGAIVSTMTKVLGDTTASITGLNAYTDYTVTISVTSSIREPGVYSTNACSFKTLEDVPTAPRNVDVTPTGTGFQVEWEPPSMLNGVVTYAVSYTSLDHATYGELETSGTSADQAGQTYEITGLRYYRQYEINVIAKTSAGSTPADPIASRTLAGPPYAFDASSTNVTVISANSARVEWAFVSGGVYRGPTTVMIAAVSPLHTAPTFTSGEDDTTTTFTGLQEGLTYDFTLTASTGTAPDQTIQISGVDTSEIAPGQPATFTYNRDTRTFSWTVPAPLDQNGVITGYVLKTSNTIAGFTSPMMFGADVFSFQLPEVPPYTEYMFTLQAINNAGQGAEFELTILTAEGVPDPVTNLASSAVEANSFTLTWTAPDEVGVLTYDVTAAGRTVTTGATQYTARDLTPYTTYTYQVVARTNAGAGSAVTGSVRTAEDVPSAVGGLDARFELDTYSILVTWTLPSPANGVISEHTVTWSANGAVIESQAIASDATSYTISGITLSSTTYTVTASATTGAGVGPATSVNVTTPELVPEMPRMLNWSNVQSDRVLLTFEPPQNTQIAVAKYTVVYSQDKADCLKYNDDDCHSNVAQDTTETTYLLTGLRAHRQYVVAVYATSVQGIVGPSTANVTFRTAVGVPGDVTNLVVVNTADGLIVNFNAPNPYVGPTTYIVIVTLSNNITLRQEITDSTEVLTDISYTFTGLDGGVQYSIQVVAMTSAGSFQTTGTPGTTSPAAPEFSITRESSSSLLISINSPGTTLMYTITYVQASCQANCTLVSPVPTNNTTISIANLQPYTAYNVTITATSSSGTGLAATATQITRAGPPSLLDTAFKLNITGSVDNTVDRSRTLAFESVCSITGQLFNVATSPVQYLAYIVREVGTEGESADLSITYTDVINVDPTDPYVAINDPCNTARRRRDSHGNEVVIGNENCDGAVSGQVCNGPLKPDTSYRVQVCSVNENDESACSAQSDPAKTEPAPTDRGLTGGEIAAIVICSILFLILIILLIVFLVRRRQSRRGKHRVSRTGRDNQGFDSTKSAVTQQKYTVDPAAEPQTQYSTPQDPQA